jgi:hypothetical protein
MLWSEAGLGLVALGAAVWEALLIAPSFEPRSTCAVTEDKISSLEMNRPYAEIAAKLGCAGVLQKHEALSDELVFDTYAWRGAGWPYSSFKGEFINGTLQGTNKLWLSLSLDWPASNASTD